MERYRAKTPQTRVKSRVDVDVPLGLDPASEHDDRVYVFCR